LSVVHAMFTDLESLVALTLMLALWVSLYKVLMMHSSAVFG
jgi:hypothetical protein